MSGFKVFQATKQRFFKKRMFGFDIETCDDNKTFLMASIVGYDRYGRLYERVFHSPDSLISELKSNSSFRNSVIFATNLSFDFFGTFFNTVDSKHFKTVFRGSDLLFSRTFFTKDGFTSSPTFGGKSKRSRSSLTFIDSLNYAKMSVKQMGDVIGFPKLDPPSFIGGRPSTPEEWVEMERYNIRDSWVTYKFMRFLIDSFERLGATFKLTIASTSMSLFKNRFLGDYKVFQPKRDYLNDIFKAYYGGRTECFKRGRFENVNYYDFNSLYPSVMYDNVFPDPNSLRVTRIGSVDYIHSFEGVSEVVIDIPYSKTPVLPVRMSDGKVVFPYGTLKGFYSHVELRKAVEDGGVIRKVFKTYFFTRTVRPFKDYVSTLYNLRLDYKKSGNPMQLVTKLFMNSLYGKFGEKFDQKVNTVHEGSISKDDLENCTDVDRVGDYFVLKQDTDPKSHCIPIWAVYVAAYGRLKLYDALKSHDTIYCDTDSLLTRDSISTSRELGALKLEMSVSEGVTVRPKFYAIRGFEDGCFVENVKIKGLAKRLSFSEFVDISNNPRVDYTKFSKFKESLRRDLIPNQLLAVHKEFSLEDSKRDWKGEVFDIDGFQDSDPLYVDMSDGESSACPSVSSDGYSSFVVDKT